ncbi:MAG: TPM domain-containing protein [Vicinamibacterales bacterium]
MIALVAPLLAQLPDPQWAVTDLAGVLDATAKRAIESRIQEVRDKTTAEIAVATVPSLDGTSVEDYATRLFKQWGIGKKGRDNGVLVLVAPTEHKIRIEVGYGLEGVLPDGLSGEIIRTNALPAFRNADFSGGTQATVGRIAEIVEANHTLTADERQQLAERAEGRPPAYLMTPFFGLFLALGGFALGVGIRTRAIFPLIWGALFGGIPGILALIPFFNASLWVLGPLALGMFVWGYVKGGAESWGRAMRFEGFAQAIPAGKGGAKQTTTAWTRSSSSSSSSSPSSKSSSSSSSGSSFGGGSSGGGGASGSW